MNNTDKAEEYHVRNGDHEKTVIMKLPKTYEEQVEIIKKKGFIVDADKVCNDFLKSKRSIVSTFKISIHLS